MESHVLKSELAGTWYSANPEHLAREIDAYLDAVVSEPVGNVIALVLPHAGYRYSGMVAAHGVKQIEGCSFSRVVVLGPSHHVAMIDSVSIPDATHIETSLGLIEIDREMASALLKNPAFQAHPYAHKSEHSVQIEFPFLQRALGDFKVLPIVCGELDASGARMVAKALLEVIDADTLVVVSTDFTHYGRSFDYVPFSRDIEENLKIIDMGAVKLIEKKDLSGFLEYVQNTGATICGRSSIAVLLAMLPDDVKVQLLKYDTSGNLTGDWAHSVSYVSAAVSGQWRDIGEAGDESAVSQADGESLSESDKITLLRLARNRITRRLKRDVPNEEITSTPGMRQMMGSFVTLRKHGRLRGCMGEIFPHRALCDAVAEQAVNSAFHDPRFPRLREDELGDIDIEISALTNPERIDTYEGIEIGRHGIVLSRGMRSAVFLPQVALEQGWGLEETLSNLALKAGLDADDWREDCEYMVFEAIVFGERA